MQNILIRTCSCRPGCDGCARRAASKAATGPAGSAAVAPAAARPPAQRSAARSALAASACAPDHGASAAVATDAEWTHSDRSVASPAAGSLRRPEPISASAAHPAATAAGASLRVVGERRMTEGWKWGQPQNGDSRSEPACLQGSALVELHARAHSSHRAASEKRRSSLRGQPAAGACPRPPAAWVVRCGATRSRSHKRQCGGEHVKTTKPCLAIEGGGVPTRETQRCAAVGADGAPPARDDPRRRVGPVDVPAVRRRRLDVWPRADSLVRGVRTVCCNCLSDRSAVRERAVRHPWAGLAKSVPGGPLLKTLVTPRQPSGSGDGDNLEGGDQEREGGLAVGPKRLTKRGRTSATDFIRGSTAGLLATWPWPYACGGSEWRRISRGAVQPRRRQASLWGKAEQLRRRRGADGRLASKR